MSKKIIRGNVSLKNLYLTKLPDLSDVEVGGGFYCSYNNLTSLEGLPKYIGGNLYIKRNLRKFTEEEIREVCEVKGNIYVK